MRFEYIRPPEYLAHYVKYFWVLESEAGAPPSTALRTMADGCPGLIFQPSATGLFFQSGKALPDTFLYGQSSGYGELLLRGRFDSVGICFHPHALQSVFGLSAGELTDSCLDPGLSGGQTYRLQEKLDAAVSAAGRIEVLCAFLAAHIRQNRRPADTAMHFALCRIVQHKGNLPLRDLHTRLGLSERSFERKFKQYVGLPPKLFSRICRFQTSLHQMRSRSYDKLSDIAFENAYADQSHFIRSFREFAGISPQQYQKQSAEIMENLSQVVK